MTGSRINRYLTLLSALTLRQAQLSNIDALESELTGAWDALNGRERTQVNKLLNAPAQGKTKAARPKLRLVQGGG